MNKLSDYFRISEAAEYFGVSHYILRDWQNVGKTTASRHPVNGQRLFIREELDALLEPLREAACGPGQRPKRRSDCHA